ncbi:hypothetical protein AK88_02756 [Plasmodium fragile]|uniref:Uncharacterized protein n=1 Tax=Plasmodium fragile TaxID=5857 RepID=A0A0D9QKW9_PLAFR|nr:uncharacterized protein AK88_02756 [Plasmodium fragile]KJP87588.1 hypothetical protein AK88_02756 [Plasmodium fragile]
MKRAKDEQTPSDEDKYEKYSLYKSDKDTPGSHAPSPSSVSTNQVESVYFVNYRAVVIKTKRYYVTQNSYMLFGDVFKIYNLKGEIKKIHAFFPGDENNLSDTLIMLKTTVIAVTTSKAEALRVADGIEMTCKICRKKRKATKFSIEGFLRKVRCDTCRVKPKNTLNKTRRANNVKEEQQAFPEDPSNTTNESSCALSTVPEMVTTGNLSRAGRKSAPLCNGVPAADGPLSDALNEPSTGAPNGLSMATTNGPSALGGSNGMGSNSASECARMHSGEANLGGKHNSGSTIHNGCLSVSAAVMNDSTMNDATMNDTTMNDATMNDAATAQQRIYAYNSKNDNNGSGTHSSFLKRGCYVGASETYAASQNNHNEQHAQNQDEIISMIIELIKYISWMQKALIRASKGNYVMDHTEINVEKISKVVHSAQVLCNKLLRQKSLVNQTGSNTRNPTNFIPMYNNNSNNLRIKYANLYGNKMNAMQNRPIETNLTNYNAVSVFNNIINHNMLSLSNCASAQRNISSAPSCSSGGSGTGSGSGSGAGSGCANGGANGTGNDSASNSTSGEGPPNERGQNGTSPNNLCNLTSVTSLTNAPGNGNGGNGNGSHGNGSNGNSSNATMDTDSSLNNLSSINNGSILPYYSNACHITCVPPSACSTRNDNRINHFIKQENNYMYTNKTSEDFSNNIQRNDKNNYYNDKQDIFFSALSKQYNSNFNISFNNINNSVSNFYRTVSKNYNIRDTILNLDK